VYAGSGDGRIFEVSLLASYPGSLPEAAPQPSSSEAGLAEGGVRCLMGHSQTVNCLSGTSNGYHLVSGSWPHRPCVLGLQLRHWLSKADDETAQAFMAIDY